MKILIAEDDRLSRRILQEQFTRWGYDVIAVPDGREAWALLQGENPPAVAILDWMMPEMDGVEICRLCRKHPTLKSIYLLMITTKRETSFLVEALNAGADDYLVKPFHQEELRARVQAAVRLLDIRKELSDKIEELQTAHINGKQRPEFLPICSYCKKIRDDASGWLNMESYLSEHLNTQFSHGICPDCYTNVLKPEIDQIVAEENLSAPKSDQ